MDNNSTPNQTNIRPPKETLKNMMAINIRDAKAIYELSRINGYMNSQEFLDWQDALNAISVQYG